MDHKRCGLRFERLISGIAAIMALFIFSTGLGLCDDGASESKTVESTGYAVISGGNILVARDAAINDGLRKAVEQAVGMLVSSETMVQDYQALSDNVYTKTQGYVKGYKIIREGQLQDVYQIAVSATVAMGEIKNDLDALGLLMIKQEKPRVLFLITERGLGINNDTLNAAGASGAEADVPAAESALKEVFLNKGFQVVDISASPDKIDASGSSSALSRDKARKIGRALNAEIVVKGKSVVREGMRIPESRVGTFVADITADVIRVDDGAVLASAKGHGASRNISEISGGVDASGKAASELAGKLVDQIIARWTSGSMVRIRLSGLTDYSKAADFKNILKKQVRGVVNVYQRSFDDGTATFDIDAKVSAQQIADDLSRLRGAPVKILNTSTNVIEAVMQGGQR